MGPNNCALMRVNDALRINVNDLRVVRNLTTNARRCEGTSRNERDNAQ
jgi:hypothetical protein